MDGVSKTGTRGQVRMPSPTTIILAASGMAIVATVALPLFERREQPVTAAADARAAYLTLMEQMGEQGGEVAAGSPVDSSLAAISSTGRLARDLFAPWSHRAASTTATEAPFMRTAPATVSRRRLPELNGILIDGNRARAVIGGQVVSAGGWVRDFQVIEIHPTWVLLKRGDQTEKLNLGGGR